METNKKIISVFILGEKWRVVCYLLLERPVKNRKEMKIDVSGN